METFTEYVDKVYRRLVSDGLMKDCAMERVPFNDVVAHATKEELAKMCELLTDEAAKADVDAEELRKEWDTLVDSVNEAKRAIADMRPPTVEEWGLPFCRNRYSYATHPPAHKSKHQCVRKPKPRQRGVKHGNRKKKR